MRRQALAAFPRHAFRSTKMKKMTWSHQSSTVLSKKEAGGEEAILSMTNFSRIEFDRVWNTVQDYVLVNWNVGWGRKSKFFGTNVFLCYSRRWKMEGSGTWWEKCSELRNPCFSVSWNLFCSLYRRWFTKGRCRTELGFSQWKFCRPRVSSSSMTLTPCNSQMWHFSKQIDHQGTIRRANAILATNIRCTDTRLTFLSCRMGLRLGLRYTGHDRCLI